jgi:hypothetical protein
MTIEMLEWPSPALSKVEVERSRALTATNVPGRSNIVTAARTITAEPSR